MKPNLFGRVVALALIPAMLQQPAAAYSQGLAGREHMPACTAPSAIQEAALAPALLRCLKSIVPSRRGNDLETSEVRSVNYPWLAADRKAPRPLSSRAGTGGFLTGGGPVTRQNGSKSAAVFMPAGFARKGMGEDLYHQPGVKEIYDQINAEARRFLGPVFDDVATYSFQTETAQMYLPENLIATHLGVLAYQAALFELLQRRFGPPESIIGFSLGMAAACYAGRALSLEEAAELVIKSTRYVQAASRGLGLRFVVIGNLLEEMLEPILREHEGVIALATAPGYFTVSILDANVPAFLAAIGDAKGKFMLSELPFVWHDPRLANSRGPEYEDLDKFQQRIRAISRSPLNLWSGLDPGAQLTSAEAVYQELLGQHTRTVRWGAALHNLADVHGIRRFVQIGSAKASTLKLQQQTGLLPPDAQIGYASELKDFDMLIRAADSNEMPAHRAPASPETAASPSAIKVLYRQTFAVPRDSKRQENFLESVIANNLLPAVAEASHQHSLLTVDAVDGQKVLRLAHRLAVIDLLRNAVQSVGQRYTSEPAYEGFVEITWSSLPGGNLLFEVGNNGAGYPREMAPGFWKRPENSAVADFVTDETAVASLETRAMNESSGWKAWYGSKAPGQAKSGLVKKVELPATGSVFRINVHPTAGKVGARWGTSNGERGIGTVPASSLSAAMAVLGWCLVLSAFGLVFGFVHLSTKMILTVVLGGALVGMAAADREPLSILEELTRQEQILIWVIFGLDKIIPDWEAVALLSAEGLPEAMISAPVTPEMLDHVLQKFESSYETYQEDLAGEFKMAGVDEQMIELYVWSENSILRQIFDRRAQLQELIDRNSPPPAPPPALPETKIRPLNLDSAEIHARGTVTIEAAGKTYRLQVNNRASVAWLAWDNPDQPEAPASGTVRPHKINRVGYRNGDITDPENPKLARLTHFALSELEFGEGEGDDFKIRITDLQGAGTIIRYQEVPESPADSFPRSLPGFILPLIGAGLAYTVGRWFGIHPNEAHPLSAFLALPMTAFFPTQLRKSPPVLEAA